MAVISNLNFGAGSTDYYYLLFYISCLFFYMCPFIPQPLKVGGVLLSPCQVVGQAAWTPDFVNTIT